MATTQQQSATDAPKEDARKQIDERLLYIIPSIVAICLSLTCLLLVFGNNIVDMHNTTYHTYINQPVENGQLISDEEALARIKSVMENNNANGYTVSKNLEGAWRNDDGTLGYSPSYEITIADVSQEQMRAIVVDLTQAFGQNMAMVDYMVTDTLFVKDHKVLESLQGK